MLPSLHILLIEDSDDDEQLVRRELAKVASQLEITRVETPEAMRISLETKSPELVLSDDQLAQFSAAGALSVLHERKVDIPFIIVSGTIGELRAVELMRLGAHDFVFKRDLRRLEQVIARELREAANRAAHRDADRRKDQFLAMIGHELRNPLAPIVTALELLHMRGADGDHEISVIKRQVDHLQRLVDDLLDVSRITRGDLVLRRERVDLREIVTRAIELSSPLLDQKRHRLDVDMPADAVIADGDRDRLTQVVAHLITNAAKFTPSSGHVAVRVSSDAKGSAIIVEDDGNGIDHNMLPVVFEPFVQGTQASDRSQGGLGLGLSIVKSLVDLHGGAISVESAPGRGSKFTVRLPLALTVSTPTQISGRDLHQSDSVLIVDDNVDAAGLLAEFLTDLGYTTHVAHDGPSALRVAAEQHPTMALLDIGLPVMDGYELGSRLKRDHKDLRMIAITGYGDATDRRRSEQAGFEAHLVKPIDLERLVKTLRLSA
ncbi:MAG: two-component hybrid sensor and regulator [Myxococcales bacterium]|nr:two-component hybrid sensor and regulator [Myxococcales bacterium]